MPPLAFAPAQRADGRVGMPRPATTGETVAILVTAVWLTGGLFLDGYAHEHILTGNESFFTPWHAVFYSGYAATVLAHGKLAWRRLGAGPRLLDCLPAAYRLSGVGAAVFACGGMGDALWHTRYGFEHGTEALYSPTHLVLLLGLALIVSGPFRAAVDGVSPVIVGWQQFALPLTSLVLTVGMIAFFAPWGLYQSEWYRVAYDPSTGIGETELNAALGAELTTVTVLIGAMLLIMRRWRPPFGTFALLFGATTAMFNLVFEGSLLGIVSAVVGGAFADVILVRLRDNLATDARRRAQAASWVGAFVMVSTWHLLLHADGDLGWKAPFAAGTPVLAALAGAALSVLVGPAHVVATDSVV